MKKKIIYMFCAILMVFFFIYCYNVESNNYDSSKYPRVFVLKAYYKTDTIYYVESLEVIYSLLNMKVVNLSECKDIIYESMVAHSAIEVDSVLFDKLGKGRIQVVNEVQKIYDNGGIFAVLDHYMKKNNVMKNAMENEISFETEQYIFYLAYLNDIYFDYEFILGDEFMIFYYSLKEPAFEELVKYRNSIKKDR